MQIYLADLIESFVDYTITYRKPTSLRAGTITIDVSVDDRALKWSVQNHHPFISHEAEDEFEYVMRLVLSSL